MPPVLETYKSMDEEIEEGLPRLANEEIAQVLLDGGARVQEHDPQERNPLEGIPGIGVIAVREGTFRCQGTRFAITFSQCPFPPRTAYETIITRDRAILNFLYVVRQQHLDGGYHLHLCIEYNTKIRTRDCRYFDWIVGPPYHANFGVVRSMSGWVSYIHDPQKRIEAYHWPPSLNLDEYVASLRLGKSKKLDVICAKIMDGELSISELKYTNPGIWIQYERRLNLWLNEIKEDDIISNMLEWKRLQRVGISAEIDTIINWLNMNIKQPRHRKQKQLWITSPPDYNKGRLVDDFLPKYLRICYASQCENFLDGYEDGKYDLIVFDDIQPQIFAAAYLGKILEGGACRVKIKGKQLIKRDNLPVIVTSNYALHELYPKVTELRIIQARVDYHVLSHPLPVTYNQIEE